MSGAGPTGDELDANEQTQGGISALNGSPPSEVGFDHSSLVEVLTSLDSRVSDLESSLAYDGAEYHDKFHHLQSLILDVRSVMDALLDTGPEHDRGEKVELAKQHRETILDWQADLEQLKVTFDELQNRFQSSSKLGKVERVFEFADGKRGKADAVAVPSDDVYGLLTDTSPRRCRQLMDELSSTLSFCETDHKRRQDGKRQKRLKIDFSRHSLEEMLAQAGRVL